MEDAGVLRMGGRWLGASLHKSGNLKGLKSFGMILTMILVLMALM
jgi:hypothetical protein